MWNEPSDEELRRLPRLGSTDAQPWRQKVIYEHFFIGACDWYAAEYDSRRRTCFGYAILHGALYNAEWGSFSLDEMKSVNVGGIEIERDLHWRARRAGEVDRIVEAHRVQGIH